MGFFDIRLWRFILAISIPGFITTSVSPKDGFFKKLKNKLSWVVPSSPKKWTIKRKLVDNFHTVQKSQLYRSAQLSAYSLNRYIHKYGIKTVINLRGANPDSSWWARERSICDKLGVRMYDISMKASEISTRENLLTLLNIYDTAPRPILIHCRGGSDRTGEAAAIWCIEKQSKSNKEASGQLSAMYGHFKTKYPKKDLLIDMWNGREWLENEYQHAKYI